MCEHAHAIKMKPKELETMLQEIVQRITPSTSERQKVTRLLQKVQTELQQQFDAAGVDCTVQIHGSIARDTWLRSGAEIDLFLVIPPPPQDQAIQHILDLVKAYLGPIWREAYADHPYLQATIQGIQIDFVPISVGIGDWVYCRNSISFHIGRKHIYMPESLMEVLYRRLEIV